MAPRWLVELEGERFDLEEFPRWFPSGDVFVTEEEGKFYVAGDALEGLPDADAVRQEVIRRLDGLAGVVKLLWPSLRKPRVCAVIREHGPGSRDISVCLEAPITMRAKAGAVGLVLGGEPAGPPPPTQAQDLLKVFEQSPRLLRALSLWADPNRSWPSLYTALDEIEKDLRLLVNKAGLCSKGDRVKFTRTANSEAAGRGARHAHGIFSPPAHPLTVSEGAGFIERLLMQVARRRIRP